MILQTFLISLFTMSCAVTYVTFPLVITNFNYFCIANFIWQWMQGTVLCTCGTEFFFQAPTRSSTWDSMSPSARRSESCSESKCSPQGALIESPLRGRP